MYPGSIGAPENHKRGYCSDGVRSKPLDNKPSNHLPQWPQPDGVFSGSSKGTTFNPIRFLAVVQEMYKNVVIGGACGAEVMEYEAFAEMLRTRTSVRADGAVLFKMYPEFITGSCPEGLVVKEDGSGETYLSMDCLRND
jgi:hypothetical protein